MFVLSSQKHKPGSWSSFLCSCRMGDKTSREISNYQRSRGGAGFDWPPGTRVNVLIVQALGHTAFVVCFSFVWRKKKCLFLGRALATSWGAYLSHYLDHLGVVGILVVVVDSTRPSPTSSILIWSCCSIVVEFCHRWAENISGLCGMQTHFILRKRWLDSSWRCSARSFSFAREGHPIWFGAQVRAESSSSKEPSAFQCCLCFVLCVDCAKHPCWVVRSVMLHNGEGSWFTLFKSRLFFRPYNMKYVPLLAEKLPKWVWKPKFACFYSHLFWNSVEEPAERHIRFVGQKLGGVPSSLHSGEPPSLPRPLQFWPPPPLYFQRHECAD